MPDTLTLEKRSALMARIRSKDTKPEMIVRRLVHAMGYRFRLHRKDLPGNPDLVFTSHKKVIFIHGCFWHMHSKCKAGHLPKSNLEYWKPKLERNVIRSAKAIEALQSLGWECLVIWECEVKDVEMLERILSLFLSRS